MATKIEVATFFVTFFSIFVCNTLAISKMLPIMSNKIHMRNVTKYVLIYKRSVIQWTSNHFSTQRTRSLTL
jgi:hypothetical protein